MARRLKTSVQEDEEPKNEGKRKGCGREARHYGAWRLSLSPALAIALPRHHIQEESGNNADSSA
jgi:hypothetical protein